jgi:tRNA A-37 threonylcarbamoyl transferase component Bud32
MASGEDYSRIWLRKYKTSDLASVASQVPNYSIRCFPYGISGGLDSSMDLLEESKPAYFRLVFWAAILLLLIGFGAVASLILAAPRQMAGLSMFLSLFCLVGPILFFYLFGKRLKKVIDNYVALNLFKVVSISVRAQSLNLYLKGQEPISIPLSAINEIELAKSKSSDLAQQDIVISGLGMKEPVRIKLSAIHTHENWMIISHAIMNFSNHIYIDDGIAKALTVPSADTSFTELWLDSLSSAPEAASLQAVPDGQTLADGRYLVRSKLASGGQGHAYLCQDQTTKQEVVIKAYLLPVYQGKRLKDIAIQQLEAESVVLQKIKHPQIVQFVDWFSTSSCAFLVLNRIAGQNLRQCQSAMGRPPIELATNLTLQMCEILRYLHSSDPPIIHRDFTPDNLIVDARQRLTLIDFTIAEPSGAVSGLPPAGKPAYMPPEQFRGETCIQSDIYALGGTLQYLLTGCDPVALEQTNIMVADAAVSPLLAEVVYRCRAAEPKDRYQSVDEIIALLQQPLRAQ